MIERDATVLGDEPKMREVPADAALQRAALDTLIRARGLDRYALFLTTREGIELAGDLEEASGYVVDEHGRHFCFWMGAGRDGVPALTTWRRVRPRPHWVSRAEYRRARAEVGLA